jgi:hypothetical protein
MYFDPAGLSIVTFTVTIGITYLEPSGHYMYRTVVTIFTNKFNIQQLYVLPTHCIYVFCVDLRTNSDFFHIQH